MGQRRYASIAEHGTADEVSFARAAELSLSREYSKRAYSTVSVLILHFTLPDQHVRHGWGDSGEHGYLALAHCTLGEVGHVKRGCSVWS